MAVEDKVDLLVTQTLQMGHAALAAEIMSGLALVCAAIALVITHKTLKALNEPLPPPPRTAALHPIEVNEQAFFRDSDPYAPKRRFENDVLAGLARELEGVDAQN